MNLRSFNELNRLKTFFERFEYLKLKGNVGQETFGFDRYLNQILYRSARWKKVRDQVMIRDEGCDLGSLDYPIHGIVIVHHMNPISMDDIEMENPEIYNPDFLISTSKRTHLAIHYSDKTLFPSIPQERHANDTIPWR